VTCLSTNRPGPSSARALPPQRGVWRWLVGLCWLLAVVVTPVRAQPLELSALDVVQTEEGVQVNFAVKFELPRPVEDALLKGVPLNFVAEAEVFRERWYWKDQRVASAVRVWRLAYQPLTRQYRVSFGGLNQNFEQLGDAMAAVQRVVRWKIAETAQVVPNASHYLRFGYKLDTSLLPRPMQIGIDGQPEWNLRVQAIQAFP
jgi:hypothetical protein